MNHLFLATKTSFEVKYSFVIWQWTCAILCNDSFDQWVILPCLMTREKSIFLDMNSPFLPHLAPKRPSTQAAPLGVTQMNSSGIIQVAFLAGEHMAEEPGRPKKSRGWRKIIFPLLKCHFLGGIQHFQANSRGQLDLGCLLIPNTGSEFWQCKHLIFSYQKSPNDKNIKWCNPLTKHLDKLHSSIHCHRKTNEWTKTSRVRASAEVIDIWRFPEIGAPPNHLFLDGIFPHKPSILGTSICGNPHIQQITTQFTELKRYGPSHLGETFMLRPIVPMSQRGRDIIDLKN